MIFVRKAETGGADASSGCTASVGSGRLCGANATLCLERGYIGSTIASAPIIGINGFMAVHD